MALDVKGKRVEVTETGFLADLQDWNEDVARAIAANEGLELSDKHWDLIRHLRESVLQQQREPTEHPQPR